MIFKLPWVRLWRTLLIDLWNLTSADYIAQNNLTCYFNNDTDRRRHLYFSRRDAGWPSVGGPRVLLSPDQFVQEYHSVVERVQKAVCECYLPGTLFSALECLTIRSDVDCVVGRRPDWIVSVSVRRDSPGCFVWLVPRRGL